MKDETTAVRRARHPATLIAVLAIVAAASFAGGFWTSRLLEVDRARRLAEERFREFLWACLDLGIVTVDRERLSEIVCIASEADLGDRGACERVEVDTR